MILRAHNWASNAHLIADVAKLGYINNHCLDATYGEGKFWTLFEPKRLVANDKYKGNQYNSLRWIWNFDFTDLPPGWYERFDTVVFDPPYKLNGTPDLGQMDFLYGVDRPLKWQGRMQLIINGAFECARVTAKGGTILVKCQDQVCSGAVRWQTDEITKVLEPVAKKVDRFDYIRTPQPQPKGRRQVHASANTSQLLVFRKR